MSHHNIGDSNSTNSSSEHSDNEERMFPDEDDEEDDEEEEDDDDDDYDEDDESSLPKNPLYPGEYPAPKQAKDYPTQPIIENLHDSKSNNFHWATLYSNNYSPKTIDIAQEKLFIGKGGSSHVALEDVNVEVSLVYIRPGEASLEITSTSGFVYVNQKPVRKGERVILQNKNEIGFYYSKTFIFTIFFNMHPSSHTQNIIPFDYSQIIPDNELPVKKFCQIDAPPRSCVSQEESLHAIFEKYGTRRISQTSPEEQAMRKQQNDEMWKYIKPHEKEAILYSCIIPFQYPHLIKYTKSLCSLYRTTLLTGPKGSMKFLSRVIRAVADYYDVPMLSVKFKALGQTVDASSQKRKGFHERQQVKFIGKGKRQREYFDEIELGTRGIVLYVKDSKAAVNFEIGERSVGSFVDVEYLGNINEEIPEYDQRVIGRLEELTDKYGPLIVSIFDIGSLNENQIFQDFKAFLRNFKFTDNKSVIFGTMVTPPPAPKTQTVQQLEPSLCMIGMKEMRFVESFPLFKNAKEQQKSLSTVTKLFGNCINVTEPSSDLLRTWKVMVADDNKITRISKNRSLLSNEAQKYGVKILQYPEDEMTEQLTQEQVIKSLGHSIQYQNNKGLNPKELPKDALAYGLSLTRVKKEVDFEELDTDNEFEKKLLGDF
ncbi:AAA+ ATPase domain-containing protein [Entamoeba marina]